jgi:hypothetical protein
MERERGGKVAERKGNGREEEGKRERERERGRERERERKGRERGRREEEKDEEKGRRDEEGWRMNRGRRNATEGIDTEATRKQAARCCKCKPFYIFPYFTCSLLSKGPCSLCLKTLLFLMYLLLLNICCTFPLRIFFAFFSAWLTFVFHIFFFAILLFLHFPVETCCCNT